MITRQQADTLKRKAQTVANRTAVVADTRRYSSGLRAKAAQRLSQATTEFYEYVESLTEQEPVGDKTTGHLGMQLVRGEWVY